ncbi:hypothetical protein ACFLTA_04725 [Bacteroidota bacterium]
MKKFIYSWILLLVTISLSAQDEVHLLAGYHYSGKILSETEDRVRIRRNDNTVATIAKPEIWKIVYDGGREIVLNELDEEIELRIGKIESQESLEEIIDNGNEREAEVACYYLIRRGYQYEFREQNLSEFSERFPNSRFRRELVSMSRFKKDFKDDRRYPFQCTDPFAPEIMDRDVKFILRFNDQLRVERTLEINAILRFIRTYGKGYKLNSGKEWKNEYEISINLDDSSEPVVIKDQYKPVGDQGDNPHMIFLNNVVIEDLNLNGQIRIRTSLGKDNGEYLIDIDIRVDYQYW